MLIYSPPSPSGPSPVPALSTVPQSLPALSFLLKDVQQHAYAPGTVRNLQSHWKKYFAFCRIYHLDPLPASPFTLSAFLTYLSCTTTSFQFVINQLHSIRILHSCHGFPCDAADSFSIALTKKGLKRIMGARPHQKHPITINLLHQIRSALQVSIPFHAAIWALFLVAFFSFLRKSNLTAPMATSFDPARHLTRSDFKFTPTGAVLRIKWSKTRQHKDGLLLVPLPSIPDCQLCPVSAIRHYFDQVPALQTHPSSASLRVSSSSPSQRQCFQLPSSG